MACVPGRRDAQLFGIRLTPARGWPGPALRCSPPDLSLALCRGDVQGRCPADPRPCRAGTSRGSARRGDARRGLAGQSVPSMTLRHARSRRRSCVSRGLALIAQEVPAAERMMIMSSSWETTSATAGHAATVAPARRWPGPCATLAVSVAVISQSQQPPRQGRSRYFSAAPSRASPLNWRRLARPPSARPVAPSSPLRRPRPHERISMLVGCHRAAAAAPTTAPAVVHLMTRSAAITGHHQEQGSWSGRYNRHAQWSALFLGHNLA